MYDDLCSQRSRSGGDHDPAAYPASGRPDGRSGLQAAIAVLKVVIWRISPGKVEEHEVVNDSYGGLRKSSQGRDAVHHFGPIARLHPYGQ